MLKTEQVEVHGRLLTVTQWNPTLGLEKLQSVLEVLGDRALPFIQGEANFSDLLSMVRSVPESAKYIRDLVLSATVAIEGRELNEATYNNLIEDYDILFKIFSLTLEVNYKTFFVNGLNEMEQLARAEEAGIAKEAQEQASTNSVKS
jgi:hypothetical protein